jgi:hypothetical protein
MKKLVFVLGITVLAFSARSQSVVFDTFGPGNTYSQQAGGDVGKYYSKNFYTEYAAGFTAQTSGDLATVDLGLTYFVQGIVNVFLYGTTQQLGPDNNSQTFLGSCIPTAENGTTNNSVVSFTVGGIVPVTAGTNYYLVLKGGDATGHELWNNSDPPVSSGTPNFGAAFSTDDTNWTFNEATLPAFRLTAIEAVPEPATYAAACMAAVVLLVRALRRRRVVA